MTLLFDVLLVSTYRGLKTYLQGRTRHRPSRTDVEAVDAAVRGRRGRRAGPPRPRVRGGTRGGRSGH
ncbi:hypothetical protein HTV80_04050 [Streptomyces sp. Vc74B-19]|uniref:hypothetical protein n=1 Tax=unclassified Streptomyces TaxID=2593676 RepID=UPI001BFC1DAA|nr:MULTISPECIES: hypothetical protein [unclassified Streptomyces]MBT3162284.1 hypothetical protein [Streptomyces sp. Vc74B-19]MDU0299097.1 hypothetical protein [Streptomyces sp. PAL114]